MNLASGNDSDVQLHVREDTRQVVRGLPINLKVFLYKCSQTITGTKEDFEIIILKETVYLTVE
jgi:hypothetical protein